MKKNQKQFISDHSIGNNAKDKITESLDLKTISETIEKNPGIINKPEGQLGWTYLYKAVVLENYDLCEFLLEKNANPNIQNPDGESPLHQAVESGNNKIINLLLENGANPNIQQKDGETSMHIACIKGDYKIVKLLIIYGADPTLKSFQNNFTPLDYAIEANQQKCISILKPLLEEHLHKQKMEAVIKGNERGFQTTKNSESPVMKQIDFTVPHTVNLPNMTSKNSSTKKIEDEMEEVDDSEFLDNVIIRNPTITSVATNNFINDLRDSKTFMNEMSKFEEKLEKIKKELNIVNNMNDQYHSLNLNSTNNDSKYQNKFKHNKYNSNLDHINMDELWQNLGKNNNEEGNFQNNEKFNNKQYNKSYFIGGSYNFDDGELVNVNNFYQYAENNESSQKEIQDKGSEENNHKYLIDLRNNTKEINGNYTFNNFDENRVITLKPDESEGVSSTMMNQNNSRISYNTSNNHEENSPNNRFRIHKKSSTSKNSYPIKISDNYLEEAETRSTKKRKRIYEIFEDNEKILAIFTSAKNDILYGEEEEQYENNDVYDSYKEGGYEYMKKESSQSNYINNNYNNFFEEEIDQNSLFTEQNNNNHNTSSRRDVKYFSKNKVIKDEFKQISLDTNTVNEGNSMMLKKSPNSNFCNENKEFENINDVYMSENSKEIFNFLRSIDLDSLTNLFLKNGFDDLTILKDQMRSNSPVSDGNLKEIGILQAGLRARILIKLEEEAGLYDFILPINIFYNIQIDKDGEWKNDHNIKSINLWLSQIKMERYLENFAKNGYHSLELLMLQMYSKNFLNDQIFEEDLKIDKVGYRSRILNKLKTDSKIYVEKLKSNKIKVINKTDDKPVDSCRCLVF